jgi:hypothetical protein
MDLLPPWPGAVGIIVTLAILAMIGAASAAARRWKKEDRSD